MYELSNHRRIQVEERGCFQNGRMLQSQGIGSPQIQFVQGHAVQEEPEITARCGHSTRGSHGADWHPPPYGGLGEHRENHLFYTRTLGMRLVKRSVNQDDVSAYHLFYADAVGSPGSDLTFFDWPVQRERRGTRSIARTHLRVAGAESMQWWAGHLREKGVTAGDRGGA
jgi:hypothetical protein